MMDSRQRYGLRPIPEYYRTMWMDGYTLEEILYAAHRKVIKNSQ